MARASSPVNCSPLHNVLCRAFGAPVPPLSVAEMLARSWAASDGTVRARWNHVGAGRRVWDLDAAAIERADLERHAPPAPVWSETDLATLNVKLDAIDAEWDARGVRAVA